MLLSFRTKILFLLLGGAVIFASFFFFSTDVLAPTEDVSVVATDPTRDESPTVVEPVASDREVSAPGGLRGELVAPAQGHITVAGIIVETNKQRSLYGLPPLSFNAQLTSAAQAKTSDMISREYFDHESPSGIGPSELVERAGYAYLSVAENLALGDYESDVALVQAWMDSPGHRENILSDTYTDIGVAVAQGMYEGYLVWFAVQEFGRPASLCPNPNEQLAVHIESSQKALKETQTILTESLAEIENAKPKSGSAYNKKVDAYNELVRRYNELLEETRSLIEEYNVQVHVYNECVRS